MWGIIPAAGAGSRIQPLAFSKELLPVGSRRDSAGERPRAVSEYLMERMVHAGASRIAFVISPGKYDILQYYGATFAGADLAYVVQSTPAGLCNAVFRAAGLIHRDEHVLIGLPDTIWFPENALCQLPDGAFSMLLFPVERPELFDAVVTDAADHISEIQVKSAEPRSRWIWGAMKLPGHLFHELHELWRRRGGRDEYLGTLINAWIDGGGEAIGVRAGESYVDVGTLHGYRQAIGLLSTETPAMMAPAARTQFE